MNPNFLINGAGDSYTQLILEFLNNLVVYCGVQVDYTDEKMNFGPKK